MWRLNKILLGILLFAIACDDVNSTDDDDGTPAGSEIKVTITADKSPAYMETATLSCSYEVTSKRRENYVAEGHFKFPSTHFAVVSGDSSWVDSLKVNEVRNHSVVIRALVRGDWLVDALVSSVIEKDVTIIGGGDSIELHVE